MTVEYQRRLEKHYDELKWLYCELYPNGQGRFEELCAAMEQWYKERNKKWKALDRKREKQKDWYKSQKMLGMMLYIDAFADNISGLEKKLDYLKECNVNYLHLMPFLATPKGKSDGGYAVADYRTVQPSLGTMEDLAALSEKWQNVHLPVRKSTRTVTFSSTTTIFRPNMKRPVRRYSRQRHRATLPGERTAINLS